jgi:pyruvate/2-oxoglutarate dehydrogenase complex dihydrolipoamide dehydrogenase (E3) component
VPGAELALVYSDIWTLPAFPPSAVVVGAASTGCQLASILQAFGAQVTLVEVSDRILAEEDDDVSGAIVAEFRQRGIEVLTGIGGVESLERAPDGGTRVRLSCGGESLTRDVAAVVFAVG